MISLLSSRTALWKGKTDEDQQTSQRSGRGELVKHDGSQILLYRFASGGDVLVGQEYDDSPSLQPRSPIQAGQHVSADVRRATDSLALACMIAQTASALGSTGGHEGISIRMAFIRTVSRFAPRRAPAGVATSSNHLRARYGWHHSGGPDGVFVPHWFAAGGVNLTVPLFTGFRIDAQAEEARLRARSSDKQAQVLSDTIARDVRVSILNAQTAFRRIAVAEQFRNQTAQALALAQTRYKLGLSSIVELSQAQLQSTQAAVATVNARYDYLLALRVLDYARGQLAP